MLAHQGFSYAGQPSALSAPGYPLLIAGFMMMFGGRYILVMRWLQFLLGLLTVGVGWSVARRLFDDRAAKATLILGLFLPTLIFTTAQILTECLSAFLTALFLLFLLDAYEKQDIRSACGLGVTAGLESMIRFNVVPLPLFAGWTVLQGRHRKSPLLRGAIVFMVPALIVMPWLLRNVLVFHGRVLFSTQAGPNLVDGIITPQGRTQPGDAEKWLKTVGWTLSQVETNDPARLFLPSEDELNRQAMHVVPPLWKHEGWHFIPFLARKTADFWLSTDQLVDTRSFPVRERLIRVAGVLAYWIVLALAVAGWLVLRKQRPPFAYLLLVYAVGFTVLHLPLVMSTRLRIPLMEPLLVCLCGAGWVRLLGRWSPASAKLN